jgi:hypothetical protein
MKEREMCKEMPVIPVNRVGVHKKNNRKKWRAKKEERHMESLTKERAFLRRSEDRGFESRHYLFFMPLMDIF